jgi:hypothetical protein
MTRQIKINEDRTVYIEGNLYSGVEGENNFELLTFTFPASLEDFNKSLIIETNNGSFVKEIKNNQYVMESEELTGEEIVLQVIFKKGNNIIGKSAPFTLLLYNSIDDSGINAITLAHSEQRESDRTDLSNSLTECDKNNNVTPEDYSSETWESLNEIVKGTQCLTTEQGQKLIYLSQIEAESAKTELNNPITSIDFWAQIENCMKNDVDYIGLLSNQIIYSKPIIFPYVKTDKLIGKLMANNRGYINQQIVECGFDCTSVPDNYLNNDTNGFFNDSYHNGGSSKSLKKIKLTGMNNIKNLNNLFNSLKNLEEIEWYGLPSDANYTKTFVNCSKLKKVTGDEIDLSFNTSSLSQTFFGCQLLQEIKFKPNTINTNISFSDCPSLSRDTVLSIINAIVDDSGITINFHAIIKSLNDVAIAKFDETVGKWVLAYSQPDDGVYNFSTILTTSSDVIPHAKGAIVA